MLQEQTHLGSRTDSDGPRALAQPPKRETDSSGRAVPQKFLFLWGPVIVGTVTWGRGEGGLGMVNKVSLFRIKRKQSPGHIGVISTANTVAQKVRMSVGCFSTISPAFASSSTIGLCAFEEPSRFCYTLCEVSSISLILVDLQHSLMGLYCCCYYGM